MSCANHSTLANVPRPIVTVNGTVIPHDMIAQEVQHHAAPTPIAAWTTAARALVVRELLLQRAAELGVAVEPSCDTEGRRETDEEALVRALIEREVHVPEADVATCRRIYGKNLDQFRAADILEPAHILIAANRSNPADYQHAAARANEVHAALRAGLITFAEAAKTYSDCPSHAQGGGLGQITRGDTTPEFEAALFDLQEGQLCQAPVATRYGFHIIRLERKIEGHVVPFDAVKDGIACRLTERAWHVASAQYLARLAGTAEIGGITLPTPADLRVS